MTLAELDRICTKRLQYVDGVTFRVVRCGDAPMDRGQPVRTPRGSALYWGPAPKAVCVTVNGGRYEYHRPGDIGPLCGSCTTNHDLGIRLPRRCRHCEALRTKRLVAAFELEVRHYGETITVTDEEQLERWLDRKGRFV